MAYGMVVPSLFVFVANRFPQCLHASHQFEGISFEEMQKEAGTLFARRLLEMIENINNDHSQNDI